MGPNHLSPSAPSATLLAESPLYFHHGCSDNIGPLFPPGRFSQNRSYTYSYWGLVERAGAVIQHLSLVGIFVTKWRLASLPQHAMNDIFVSLTIDVMVMILTFFLAFLLQKERKEKASLWHFLRSFVLATGYLWLLCPVLQTLTKAFSDDTAIALTSTFLLIHVVFYDYSYTQRASGRENEPVGSAVAVNSGMLASVVMASRLQSDLEVFAFLFFGIETFALSPTLGRLLWRLGRGVYIGVTTALFCASVSFLGVAGTHLLVILFLVSGASFVAFFGPSLLIYCMKYKREIRGPWDLPSVPIYN